MITRPLDLASKLRPEPRSLDALFFVNTGLVVFFFYATFSSRFVLAPGLGVDFQIQQISGAQAGASATTHNITVQRSGLIIIGDGPADLPRLREWLKAEAKKVRQPSLLVKASGDVPAGIIGAIWSAAHDAGFTVSWAAEEPAAPGGDR